MRLSVVIPANEEGSIAETGGEIAAVLEREDIDHEVIVVDDGSTDSTAAQIARLAEANPKVRYARSPYRNGFGFVPVSKSSPETPSRS
jgi:glycosyltransferase involved in cell wall biosynthesis